MTLPAFPNELWEIETFGHIGSILGTLVRVDSATARGVGGNANKVCHDIDEGIDVLGVDVQIGKSVDVVNVVDVADLHKVISKRTQEEELFTSKGKEVVENLGVVVINIINKNSFENGRCGIMLRKLLLEMIYVRV